MNDEPSGSAETARDGGLANPEDTHVAVQRAIREKRKRTKLLFNKKREHFLKDFLRNIDILVYAELATVYYMEYAPPLHHSCLLTN